MTGLIRTDILTVNYFEIGSSRSGCIHLDPLRSIRQIMKVGVYIAGYAPEAGGGYTFERDVLHGLLNLHRDSRHSFVILCPSQVAALVQRDAASAGLPVFPVTEPAGFMRRMVTVERESSIWRAHWHRPSRLDRAASSASVNFLWFISAGVHRTDLPFLTVVWDLQHRVTPWFPEMSSQGIWDSRELSHAWFLRRATGVIVGTHVGREELERFYGLPSDRIIILPHPTPTFALEAGGGVADKVRLERLGVHEPFIFYPAQFWAHKNHVNLLMGLHILRIQHRVPVTAVLVGSDKGTRNHVQKMAAQYEVADAVRFLGFVTREDLIALYRGAVALAYVSWCGPENLPPLEAFALGCPVVASDIPGAREQLADAAVFIKPGDPTSIAEGILQVWNDRNLRDRLVKAGYKRAQQWTASDYVRGVFRFLDRFEPISRCWAVS